MDNFSITTKISKKAFLLLSLYLTYSHSLLVLVSVVGLIALVYSIFQMIVFEIVSFLLPVGIILLLLPLMVIVKANLLYDKSEEFSNEFIWEFNDSHFKVIGQQSIDSITWNKVVKLINVKNYLIIFTGIHTAKIIDARSLTESQKRFIAEKCIEI